MPNELVIVHTDKRRKSSQDLSKYDGAEGVIVGISPFVADIKMDDGQVITLQHNEYRNKRQDLLHYPLHRIYRNRYLLFTSGIHPTYRHLQLARVNREFDYKDEMNKYARSLKGNKFNEWGFIAFLCDKKIISRIDFEELNMPVCNELIKRVGYDD